MGLRAEDSPLSAAWPSPGGFWTRQTGLWLLSNGKGIHFRGSQGLGFLFWGSGGLEILSLILCNLGTPHPVGLQPRVAAKPGGMDTPPQGFGTESGKHFPSGQQPGAGAPTLGPGGGKSPGCRCVPPSRSCVSRSLLGWLLSVARTPAGAKTQPSEHNRSDRHPRESRRDLEKTSSKAPCTHGAA